MEFALSTNVTSGSVRTNILELKNAVTEEMAKYHEIVVTEDNLKNIKETLAKLRAFEKQAKAAFKSAQDQYDEPVKIAKADFDSILQVVKDAEDALDVQVKEIESRQRDEKLAKCMDIMAEMVDAESDSVVTFTTRCIGWIQKKEWGNKTYTEKQVREDIKKAIDDIKLALDSFQGEFSNQQLSDYAEFGDYQRAFRLGLKLQKDKEQMEAVKRAREEENARKEAEEQKFIIGKVSEEVPVYNESFQQVSAVNDEPKQEPNPNKWETIPTGVYPTPLSFVTDEASKKRCIGHFEVRGPRFAILWLIGMAKIGGLEMTKEVKNG
ncbi:MAG: DUF1351 domain-containing protein [Sphaerochaeta sp.]